MAELREDVAQRYADLGSEFSGEDEGPSGFGPLPTGLVENVDVCDIVRWMAIVAKLNPTHPPRCTPRLDSPDPRSCASKVRLWPHLDNVDSAPPIGSFFPKPSGPPGAASINGS
ncbi:MAG: hypothetical protein AAFV32_02445 [Myxococcota bacterium]